MPPISPSLAGIKVLEIFYIIKLNFDATGMSISTSLELPIVIGTMPLRDTENPAQQQQAPIPYELELGLYELKPDPARLVSKVQSSTDEVLANDQNKNVPVYIFYKDFTPNT